jgi:hypothetical protein
VRIRRKTSLLVSSHFSSKMEKLLFRNSTFEEGSGIDPGRGMTLKID